MNKAKWIFCNLVLKLDWIPRCGRFYPLLQERDDDGLRIIGPAEWSWQRRGRWGMYFLDRVGLLWPWIDEVQKRKYGNNKKEPDATP